MFSLRRCARFGILAGLSVATGAYAQVSSINSAVIQSRVFNDVPGATFSGINSYPTFIALSESGVSQPTGFANRDVWRFSNNGTTPYTFAPNDYFSASMTLTLSASSITPRKEAGFLFSTGSNGDIQFIVDTDAHEVVQFGGISFYSFNANNNITYTAGTPITLGMTYFLDGNGKNALQFSANGVNSPVFEFGPSVGSGASDIGTGSILGGYLQVVNDPANSGNSGSALFQNVTITSVPEPSVFALLGCGALALVGFRLRRS